MIGHLLFVYGTLRRGGVNAITKLYPDAEFVGDASVDGMLYDMGGYPALVLAGDGARILGEVYRIDETTLASLDEFEADAEYDRERIEVDLNGDLVSCWIYRPEPQMCAGKRAVAGGDWIEYAEMTGKPQ